MRSICSEKTLSSNSSRQRTVAPVSYTHLWCESELTVDYGPLYELRYRVLNHAYRRFTQNPPEDYRRFCEENVRWQGEIKIKSGFTLIITSLSKFPSIPIL